MKKHPKTAFGFLEDGPSLKMAHLVRDAYQMYLMTLDRVDLDQPLYQQQEQIAPLEEQPWNDENKPGGDVPLDEFKDEYVSGFKMSPWERLFGTVRLEKGVIALNVNEDQITRISPPPISKADEKELLRHNLTPQQYKSREWQTSRVSIGRDNQFWLYKGVNQLLEILGSYSRRHHKRYYYQLADANDIALTDYYRINCLGDEQRVLLVYLGLDYRKAFLFDQGDLVDIFPLNITQPLPEPEFVYARIALALDNAQQSEPQKMVFCGDLASEAIVSYFNQQNPETTSLLEYPLLAIDSLRSGLYDASYLAQYAIPIALAYKALHPEDARYTRSNFLPGRLIEAQRTFKIAWHGFLIMFLIFAVTLLGTLTYLSANQKYDQAKNDKRQIDYELAVLKINTAEVTKMQADIAQFSKNTEAMRTVLAGKNPWSAVLDTLNRLFQSKPTSWLTNLSKDGARLKISGFTTNRGNVIDFADALPNSRIQKVTSSTIHNKTVWTFEITSDFPKVDWIGQIEAEMASLLEQQQLALELQKASEVPPDESVPEEAATPAETKPAPATPPQQTAPATTAGEQLPTTIQPLAGETQPYLSTWQNQAGGDAAADFAAFQQAVSNDDLKLARRLGENYLYRYEGGRLIPQVRWQLANLLYNHKLYQRASSVLQPLTEVIDRHYPYTLLLSARIAQAGGQQDYQEFYDALIAKYPGHPAARQAQTDLDILRQGGGQ